MSPISSRNRVPRSASRKEPSRSDTAPVKAPRTWPNSSLSSNSLGMAAQLMATKGWRERRPWAWIARATTSLPVPVSPVISTVASLSASKPIDFCTARIPALEPTSASGSETVDGPAADWAGNIRASKAARSSRPTGFARWSTAPSRIASIVLAAVGTAVSTATAGGVSRDRMRRSTSIPSNPGMRRSSRTASGANSFEHGQRRFAIGGFTGLVAEISQGFGKPLAKHVVVIDDQDACHGSSMVKMAPRPGASPPGRSRTTRPPCASASSRAIASPSPVPSA